MLKLWTRAVGDYQVNTFVVWCEATRKAAVIDPSAEPDEIIDIIEKERLEPVLLLNTHGHLDHIGENAVIKARYGVPLMIHALDRPMLTNAAKNLSLLTGDPITSPDADRELKDGDVVGIGEETLTVLHVPGHTTGSVAFYQPGLLISGDTLFAQSVGRTDLPGGSADQLDASIRTKLYVLPDVTRVYPGHGPATSIGEERRHNPFIHD